MRPIAVNILLAAASANNIALSQTPAGAGAITLNGAAVSGGIATLDVARRVLITAVGNESAKTLTLTGTDRNGNVISEVITGPNATTAQSLQDYKTVTLIVVSAAFAGAITVGTSVVASSRWVPADYFTEVFNVGYFMYFNGTSGGIIMEATADDPNAIPLVTIPRAITLVTQKTGDTVSNFTSPVRYMRITTSLATVTSPGVDIIFIQQGRSLV